MSISMNLPRETACACCCVPSSLFLPSSHAWNKGAAILDHEEGNHCLGVVEQLSWKGPEFFRCSRYRVLSKFHLGFIYVNMK